MADIEKLVHKPRSPPGDCPKIDSIVITRTRKWVKSGTCVSHDRRDLQALLGQPSAPDSHLPEGSVHPLDVDSRHLFGFEPNRGYEMVRPLRVRQLYFLDLRWVEAAVDGTTQAAFVEKIVNELGICSELRVRGALGSNASRRACA